MNDLATISNYIMLKPPSAEGFSLDLSSMTSKGSATYFRTQITNIEKKIVYSAVSEPLDAPVPAESFTSHATLCFSQKNAAFQKWPGGSLTFSRTFTKLNVGAMSWNDTIKVGSWPIPYGPRGIPSSSNCPRGIPSSSN